MNLCKVVDSVHSEFGFDLSRDNLLSNLTTASSISLPDPLSKLKLVNLVFLHSFIDSNLGKYTYVQENHIYTLVDAIHREVEWQKES